MMVFHSRWNASEIDKVITKPSARMTLLRDPVDTFESGYVYMGLEKAFNMDINTYAQNIAKTFPKRDPKGTIRYFYHEQMTVGNIFHVSAWFGQNQLLWDLGIDPAITSDFKALQKIINAFDDEFDLVMIAERFDESLILMKDLLCWNMEDILYIKVRMKKAGKKAGKFFFYKHLQMNERLDKFKSTTMSPETRLILQQWQWADYQLYSYFNHKLSKKLEDFGQAKLLSSLQELQMQKDELQKGCAPHIVDNSELEGSILQQGHEMVKAININVNCTNFILRETEFVKMIRIQQSSEKPSPHI